MDTVINNSSDLYMLTKIGNYHLKQSIFEATDLREFEEYEYELAEKEGIKRTFKEEQIFYGENIFMFDDVWNVMIGSIEQRIYKISLRNIRRIKSESDEIYNQLLHYLNNFMGKYSDHSSNPNLYIWDDEEGNVIAMQTSFQDFYLIDLYITAGDLIRKNFQ